MVDLQRVVPHQLSIEEVENLTELLMKRLDLVCEHLGGADTFEVFKKEYASDDGYQIPACIHLLRDYMINIIGRANSLGIKSYGLIGALVMTHFDVDITPVIYRPGVADLYENLGYYMVFSHSVTHLVENLFHNVGTDEFDHYLKIFMTSAIEPYAHRKSVATCKYDDGERELITSYRDRMAMVFRIDDVVFVE
jgi:hypothetical protein